MVAIAGPVEKGKNNGGEKKNETGQNPAARLPKLLLVEDQKLDVILMQAVVKNRYQLFSAANSTDAMKILTTEKDISLILMNIGLPGGKSGAELAAELKSSPVFGSIPVMAVSALNKEAGWDGLFVDYMQKPYDIYELKAKIDQHAIPLAVASQ